MGIVSRAGAVLARESVVAVRLLSLDTYADKWAGIGGILLREVWRWPPRRPAPEQPA